MRASSVTLGTIALLSTGCDGPTSPRDAAVEDGGAGDGGGGPAADAGSPRDGGLAPSIADAYADCAAPGRVGGLSGGRDLLRVDIDTEAFPEARCADGTAALFFVRPASDPADRDRWHLSLQGGGACRTPEACAARWCGMDGSFGGNKLSSRYAPAEGMAGGGLLSAVPENPFGTWNQVFVYYCSSDLWTGAQGPTVREAPHPVAGGDPVPFTIELHGSQIIDAVIGTLRSGVTTDLGRMPDLGEASELVFSGASAGGAGVIHNLDRVAAELRAANPDVRVHGVIDSIYKVRLSRLDFEPTSFCVEQGACSYEALMQNDYVEVMQGLWNARLEGSCEPWHETMRTGEPWRCADETYVLENHVTTPFVVRMGLRDGNIGRSMAEAGFRVPELGSDVELTLDIFAQLLGAQLLELTDLSETAAEGADVTVEPGVFGPNCPKHETLRSDGDTYDASVEVSGMAMTFPELLRRWRSGSPAAAVWREGLAFGCPP